MKFLAEYRDPELARALVEQLRRATTRPWTIMEICGGQTHSILRHGIDQVLPPGLELVHGPGCPVCVTPLETIDRAVAIAELPGTILTSFGDMLRVPGSRGSLLEARSRGADVRMVYSPLEALALARANPDREVVFLAVACSVSGDYFSERLLRANSDHRPVDDRAVTVEPINQLDDIGDEGCRARKYFDLYAFLALFYILESRQRNCPAGIAGPAPASQRRLHPPAVFIVGRGAPKNRAHRCSKQFSAVYAVALQFASAP